MNEPVDTTALFEWFDEWIDLHVTLENFRTEIPKAREAFPMLVSLFLSMNASGARPTALRVVTQGGMEPRGGASKVLDWPKGEPASNKSVHARLPRSSTPGDQA